MKKVHITTSKILTYGTVLSLLLIVLALIEMLLLHTSIETYSSVDILPILNGLFSMNPTDTLYSSLLVIIFTPVASLIYLTFFFLITKDIPMIIFSFTVLCIIVSAVIMGLGS
ncbi:protein of unknown function DUF1634 [Flexistipes sinusarabici DSM 4947]|uniref:DUF1634 domain-containing protein n=1 Tax=Flexistipes sinusarabici (strain ATCC 49648 / DSM 4947 / MAS 10) TaxID=717231 RepID=F8E7S5_FLESM|nr:DUF1634 domain-containing protein [Flexistipes sinusarabici]AEI13920.1 protein of unknown function DUF1634 [Flexistipes sinusarabici DSM 4947]